MAKKKIEIFGVMVPVSEKVLYLEKTGITLEYVNALKEGKGEAERHLKGVS